MGIINNEELNFLGGLKRGCRISGIHFRGALLLLLFVFLVGGCAQLQKDFKDGIAQFLEELKRERLEDREGAINKFGYTGEETEIIVESLVITPYTVKPGSQLKLELKYALLSPEAGTNFLVVENVIFHGNQGEKIDLLANKSEKAQGVHLLTLNMTVPQDIEPGEYHITNTISTVNLNKTARGSFMVKK